MDFISVQVVLVIKFDSHEWKLKHNGKQGIGGPIMKILQIFREKVSEAL